MNFNFLAENSLSFYPVSHGNTPENVQDAFMRSEEQLQQLQISKNYLNLCLIFKIWRASMNIPIVLERF